MKKIISILLVGFILIWSYHLFIDSLFNMEEVKEEPYKGVIKIWDSPKISIASGSRYGWIQSKIRAFEKKNPGVYIEFVPMDEDNLYNDFEKNLSSGDLPNILPINNYFNNFDRLEPLDDYFEKQELEEFKYQALRGVTYEKQMMAVPIGMTTYCMYLNLDKFHEAGVSPPTDNNWTYEEFIEALKRLNIDEDGDEIIDSYGFMSYIGNRDYSIWGIILSDGAEFINPKRGEYAFYGEKAIKGLEKAIDLKDKHRVAPDYFGMISKKESWELFYKEKKIAVYPTDSRKVNFLDNLYNNGEGFNFDIVNYPMGGKKIPVILSDGLVSYGVVKDDNIKRMEMCVKFLKFLTNTQNQKSLEDIGIFTVKRGIKDMYMENHKMKKIEETLSYTYYIPFMKNWKEIDNILYEEIRSGLLLEKPSYEVIEEAKIRIHRLKE
ncbi:extracellular solute-binding protein [Tissierella sp. MSJ-40]|uniref:Extracellular solute-binding protein n=1 Tax=Tissierella simiarum TaxID=2841534 RepID=A0ABS6E694_9FIRM|nr:extracellular solute-binding protein [Tissierella simiarum]MBU5438453.1 extracellular solute-binding protein [Tissierella simiarum]